MSARISPLAARRRKENAVQRTQITFPSDKASSLSLPRTRHNNTFHASRAILSQSSLFHVRSRSSYVPIFLSQRFLPASRGGEGEGINISRELITALGRYKVHRREGGSRKVLRNCNTTCEVFGGREILYGCILYAERRGNGTEKEILLGRLFIAANLFRNCEIYLIIYMYRRNGR